MSSYRVNICELTLGQLNAQCLIKINQLAKLVERQDPTIELDLSDDQVIRKLVRVAKKSKDPEVQCLYVSSKEEISKHINSPRFTKQLDLAMNRPNESASQTEPAGKLTGR